MSAKPRVFLSSTIYDFADLRSALKFWFEELAFDVDASEFNDFQKPVDVNSYAACLAAIDAASYFVLLIGSRAGGWYDATSKTTITMQEYRHAYERARRGDLKLLIFARRAVWDVREDRDALGRLIKEEYAKEHALSPDDIEKIRFHSSRVVENAGLVFAFLSEVARNAEMKEASVGGAPFPPANWIHRFDSFRDIVSALRVELGGGHGLRRVALAANLRSELVENLRQLLQRNPKDGSVTPAYEWAAPARSQFRGGPLDYSSIQGKRLMWLSLFAVTGCSSASRLTSQFLDEALVSGEFLEFDHAAATYVVGPLQSALLQARLEILRLQDQEPQFSLAQRRLMLERFRPLKDVVAETVVDNADLVAAMSLHDRQSNLVSLMRAIVRALDGESVAWDKVSLRPVTPFAEEAVQIDRETPSGSDVDGWVKLQ